MAVLFYRVVEADESLSLFGNVSILVHILIESPLNKTKDIGGLQFSG